MPESDADAAMHRHRIRPVATIEMIAVDGRSRRRVTNRLTPMQSQAWGFCSGVRTGHLFGDKT